PPLLVARLMSLAEVSDIVRAALEEKVALVPLEEGPVHRRPHALVIHAPGLESPLVLNAEPAGAEAAGLYPLRFEWLDRKQKRRPEEFMSKHGVHRSPHPSSKGGIRVDRHINSSIAGGKYRIESVIGVGAFGRVYRARHLALNKPVAIKMLLGP